MNMKKLIEQVDRLLALLNVSGENVIILASARQALGEAYRMLPEDAPKQSGDTEEKNTTAEPSEAGPTGKGGAAECKSVSAGGGNASHGARDDV